MMPFLILRSTLSITIVSLDYPILVSDLTYRITLVRLRRTTFQAWTSVSLVIDVIISVAMAWSVRD